MERASRGNYPDIDELIYSDEHCNEISLDSINSIPDFTNIAFDDYVGEDGVVKVTVLRAANEQDLRTKEAIQTAERSGPPLRSVTVDCSAVDALLEAIVESDQQNRQDVDCYSFDTDWHNLEQVVAIINSCDVELTRQQYGVLWLVIQHAPYKYRKTYVSYFKELAKLDKIYFGDVAMMQDRILIDEGEKQLYGTQLGMIDGRYQLLPVQNPNSLNHRRLAAGMDSIETYLLEWGIVYE